MAPAINIPLPITSAAFHRFGMEARALGLSLEAYLARLSERGFGVPIAKLISTTLEDAAAEMASNEEAIRAGTPRLFGNPITTSKRAA